MPGTATAADLRRHPRRRPAAVLARAGFAPVSGTGRGEKTPPHAPPRHRLRALPSRLNGQSRALIIVLLTTRSVAIPGAPHCRRWAEASGVATGARYAGTPVRLADKADVVKPPSAGEPLYCNAYLQVVSVKQALKARFAHTFELAR